MVKELNQFDLRNFSYIGEDDNYMESTNTLDNLLTYRFVTNPEETVYDESVQDLVDSLLFLESGDVVTALKNNISAVNTQMQEGKISEEKCNSIINKYQSVIDCYIESVCDMLSDYDDVLLESESIKYTHELNKLNRLKKEKSITQAEYEKQVNRLKVADINSKLASKGKNHLTDEDRNKIMKSNKEILDEKRKASEENEQRKQAIKENRALKNKTQGEVKAQSSKKTEYYKQLGEDIATGKVKFQDNSKASVIDQMEANISRVKDMIAKNGISEEKGNAMISKYNEAINRYKANVNEKKQKHAEELAKADAKACARKNIKLKLTGKPLLTPKTVDYFLKKESVNDLDDERKLYMCYYLIEGTASKWDEVKEANANKTSTISDNFKKDKTMSTKEFLDKVNNSKNSGEKLGVAKEDSYTIGAMLPQGPQGDVDDVKKSLNKDSKVVTEAANINPDMKGIIAKLNSKGYKTKYSSSGHPGDISKHDSDKDHVSYGKMYSTARIMFADDYNFPKAPKYWIWKTVEGKDYLDVQEPYVKKENTTKEDVYDWKNKYMSSLETWVDNLPNVKDSDKVVVDKKGTKNDVVTESTTDLYEALFDETMFELGL